MTLHKDLNGEGVSHVDTWERSKPGCGNSRLTALRWECAGATVGMDKGREEWKKRSGK